MLGFELTEEQRELKALAHKFAEQEMIPRAREYDGKELFPRDVCQKAFGAGLMNFGVPREHGGPGLSILDTCLIGEELNYGCAGITNAIAFHHIDRSGLSEAQKEREFCELILRAYKAQPLDDLGKRRRRLRMLLEPAEGEVHDAGRAPSRAMRGPLPLPQGDYRIHTSRCIGGSRHDSLA